MAFRLDWSARWAGRVATLRNARGSGNPTNSPYRLMIVEQGRPLGAIWLSRTDLATLVSQVSRELNIQPITGEPFRHGNQ
jgi:hypothetical protein